MIFPGVDTLLKTANIAEIDEEKIGTTVKTLFRLI